MPETVQDREADNGIILGLLKSVEQDGGRSQRRLAAELGIALGLVNAYLKRCVSKGLVKVQNVPARRYAYYLTPKGFAEKSRLTVNYLTSSFGFFREAKADCLVLFEVGRSRGFRSVVLVGRSDLAEIAVICAMECQIEIVALVDPKSVPGHFLGIPIVSSFDVLTKSFDAVAITDLESTYESWDRARLHFGESRVLLPRLLGVVKNQESVGQ
ncbi:winged helix-turn-helix transcriptional regulator [Bradyrhizobium sp. KBS0727]|uniref:winged helix-turn-helix transcriptional regulator n=1 Tax=unclassified Bradyrhizobium TaxID=2631580 RepID=UPI00110D3A4E|nr:MULTISPECIES: winged helix-turn-helix transcriptional regulator [unclassified Bradyrhizobium]QDW39806.1 winged helix-turn-helix transcriptional regulator [Bradyrhizobium sp. KBS0725]QDW46409.1 winged helix-turn-helix transcriptional regulator [Bradyrhizobium sp. KBS0727]